MSLEVKQVTIREPTFAGEFYLPLAGGSSTGLIIVPSSAGVMDVRERAYATFFASNGLPCVIADAFTLHGVRQCLTDQTLLTDDDLLACAFDAVPRLKNATSVTRVGIMGVSKGGFAALQAALYQPHFSCAPHFAFHIALVPPVAFQFRHPRALGGPILVLLAEKDDFTPATHAKKYVQRICEANPDITLDCRVVSNAHHAWESRGEIRWLATAERYDHCLFMLEDNGTVTDTNTGQNIDKHALYAGMRSRAELGAHYGGGDDSLFIRTCDTLHQFILQCDQ